MSPRASKAPSTDFDLRIKAGAALTCDLSTRMRAANVTADASTRRPNRSLDLALSDSAAGPWFRAILYVAFALAIAVPWVLLLANQLSG
jgi:hypothetical protein